MEDFRRDGVTIPKLGFGTFELKDKTAREMVHHALEVGYRHIDTARMYENEDQVGLGIQDSDVDRDDIFLTTKLWHDDLPANKVREATEESLQKLRTDYVDLLLIHWPVAEIPVAETLGAMKKLQDEGKVHHLGVSNFPSARVEEACAVPGVELVCNQVEYHPFLRQRTLLQTLEKHDMALTAYSPLAQGDVIENATLVQVAKKHGATTAQVTLRWLLDRPRVIAIPRSSNPEHCTQNLGALDLHLDEVDRAAIDALQGDRRKIDPSFAPEWDRF